MQIICTISIKAGEEGCVLVDEEDMQGRTLEKFSTTVYFGNRDRYLWSGAGVRLAVQWVNALLRA